MAITNTLKATRKRDKAIATFTKAFDGLREAEELLSGEVAGIDSTIAALEAQRDNTTTELAQTARLRQNFEALLK